MTQSTKDVTETIDVRDGAPGQGTNARSALTLTELTFNPASNGTNATGALVIQAAIRWNVGL
jgi:hypothetical protein